MTSIFFGLLTTFTFISNYSVAQEKAVSINYNQIEKVKNEDADFSKKNLIILKEIPDPLPTAIVINDNSAAGGKINIKISQSDLSGKYKSAYDATTHTITFTTDGGKFTPPFQNDNINAPLSFQFNSKTVVITNKAVLEQTVKPSDEKRFLPVPSTDDFLESTTSDLQKSYTYTNNMFTATDYTHLNKGKRSIDNNLVYSFCDNKLFFKRKTTIEGKPKTKIKFRPKVGEGLNFELNTVPNPLRYDITIRSEYKSYNHQTDSLLETFLLNPSNFISTIPKAQSSSDIDDKKNKILGFLQTLNTQLNQYFNKYKYSIDCIDGDTFSSNKQKVENNINKKFKAAFPNYPGNLRDFISNEFIISDSSWVKPVLAIYKQFQEFNVTPVKYHIPDLDNADELLIHLTIKPKENSVAGLKVDSMDIKIPIFGGFKVDVSPGLFYTHFSSNSYSLLSDSTHGTSSTGGDSITGRFKTIIPESKNKGDFGVSTLMHFYSRWGKDVNIAASIGAGITIADKPQIRYLAGGSILLGRINRLAFTGGWAWGRIEEVSDKYKTKDGYRKVNFSETSLETKKRTGNAWFVSLSYNVPLLKRKN